MFPCKDLVHHPTETTNKNMGCFRFQVHVSLSRWLNFSPVRMESKFRGVGGAGIFISMHTWNPNEPIINSCFNWMMNQIFTWEMAVLPFPSIMKSGCLKFQARVLFHQKFNTKRDENSQNFEVVAASIYVRSNQIPVNTFCIHPGRLTWNLTIHPWKMGNYLPNHYFQVLC